MKVSTSNSGRKTQTSWATKKFNMNTTQNQSFITDKRTSSSCSYRNANNVEEELGRTFDGLMSTYVE